MIYCISWDHGDLCLTGMVEIMCEHWITVCSVWDTGNVAFMCGDHSAVQLQVGST